METTIENPSKVAGTNGLIIGIIAIMILIVLYYVYPSALGSSLFGLIYAILLLIVYITFTIDMRKKIGGYWSFKEALKGIFLMAFIAGLTATVINLVFFKFIEPGGYEKISVYVTENSTRSFENMGMDQKQIDRIVEGQLAAIKSQYDPTPRDLLKNLSFSIAVQFVMSLIFAAIFKKDPPLFIQAAEE